MHEKQNKASTPNCSDSELWYVHFSSKIFQTLKCAFNLSLETITKSKKAKVTYLRLRINYLSILKI